MALQKIGHGIFTWSGSERRSNRYGSFNLLAEPYGKAPCAQPTYDKDLAETFQGKRVRIICKVVATRQSGHIGDLFLGIQPSTPEVGEEVDLGVGIFQIEPCEWDKNKNSTFLAPGDDREELWIDPRKLYRLHDQTVDVFVEETTDEFTPEARLGSQDSGMVSAESLDLRGDGGFQTKHVGDLFIMTPAGVSKAGERVEFVEFDQDGNPTVWDKLRED